jgi:hypothetical protein
MISSRGTHGWGIHHRQVLTPARAGIKAKVENQGQYDEYLTELKDIREELGVNLKEVMYPEGQTGQHD